MIEGLALRRGTSGVGPLPAQMLRYDRRSGNLAVTDLGRAASHFYISNESVFRFNGAMRPKLSDAEALSAVCLASEFDQVKVRHDGSMRRGREPRPGSKRAMRPRMLVNFV